MQRMRFWTPEMFLVSLLSRKTVKSFKNNEEDVLQLINIVPFISQINDLSALLMIKRLLIGKLLRFRMSC
ncbi:hypothetical protein C427_1168 [Paraglaciecola psychrophila 170]|uniref:Uncharacterized protein n=1 Tax=Paraglaciecola psychrophila 170 TaxID=1129794 RepID=K7A8B4_9ALTE|nr:hypothetical protein C427_1168 [Paraglaciecola psychrophila 170]GAC37003.1 hypothetical protein GPSY_1368 [Paraglaciecola psychrophila 170]